MRSSVMPIVAARGLIKEYGRTRVVDRISFSIEPGEFLGILGPNGAGKTTTLKMLVGRVEATAGELSVLGFDIPRQAREMRSRIGIVPQQDNLDPEFTVVENLRVYARYFGLSGTVTRGRIARVLDLAALADKAHARISQLSGGMKRRLSIARALLNEPELLILDEPTTGLDPQIRQAIWHLLRQLQKDGLTIVLTTHYMDEAERLCERIILMDHGHILADQSPQELVQDRIEPHVLEVHGPAAEPWALTVPPLPGIRCERVGETFFYYGEQLEPLIHALDRFSDVQYNYRSTSLEDVFLKLTGRDLRDA